MRRIKVPEKKKRIFLFRQLLNVCCSSCCPSVQKISQAQYHGGICDQSMVMDFAVTQTVQVIHRRQPIIAVHVIEQRYYSVKSCCPGLSPRAQMQVDLYKSVQT